jgi:hypothetical protein
MQTIEMRANHKYVGAPILIKDCLAMEYWKGKRLGDKGEAETRL